MIWGKEDIYIYIQANALTDKNRTTAVHRGSLVFVASELMIEELSIASAGIYELKAVDALSVISLIYFKMIQKISLIK